MDFLKAEIASKKRPHDSGQINEQAGPSKYMRKGELERLKREEASRAEEARRRKQRRDEDEKENRRLTKAAKETVVGEQAEATSSSANAITEGSLPASEGHGKAHASKPETFNVSNSEAVRRLRAKGQPIRLFGEADNERRLRLRALELIEERSEGQRNDFMRTLEGMDKGLDLEELQRRAMGGSASLAIERLKESQSNGNSTPESETEDMLEKAGSTGSSQDEPVDLSLIKRDSRKLYPQIYFGIKKVLKEWELAMAARPDHVRRSQQGRLAAATQVTSAENLKPLFKSLRKRDLQTDVLHALAEIVHFMQMREYLKANDSYLRLSIGNAPWPIGVTMVGIHERSAREKIHSNQVAHVLNDEVSRKYIQSLKRLLTFAQTIRPPDDLSQRMG